MGSRIWPLIIASVLVPAPLTAPPAASTDALPAPAPAEASGDAEQEVTPVTPSAKKSPTLYPIRPDEVGLLMNNTALGNVLKNNGLRSFGWLEAGYTYRNVGPGSVVRPFPNYISDEPLINQLYVVLEKPMSERELSWGWRVDLNSGSDAVLFQPPGEFGTKPNQRFGLDFQQLFVSAHLPILSDGGVDVKFGRMLQVVGVGVALAPLRPFYSNDYQFSINGMFTGVLATWHVNPQLDIVNSVNQGWDTFFTNLSGAPTYLGQVNYWLQPEKRTFVSSALFMGPEQTARISSSNIRTLYVGVLQQYWTPRFAQALQTEDGWEQNVPHKGNSQWYSFMNIFVYRLTRKLDLLTRAEWFDDVQGSRTGFATNYEEATLSANYHPFRWLMFRPEIRGDFANDKPAFRGRHKMLSLGMDCTMMW